MKYLNFIYGRKSAPFFFLTPNLLIFTCFVIFPAIIGFYYSFTEYDGLNKAEWIGLANYQFLFTDKEFWYIFGKTFLYVGISVPLIYWSSLLVAVMLIKPLKAKGFYRAVYYWPTMISFVVIGLMWRWILGESFGLVNFLLNSLGFGSIQTLSNPYFANTVVILVTVWSRLGFYLVIFIAGLQSIPDSLYEASDIDGASSSQKFWHITLPMVKPISLLVITLSTIETFKSYPLILNLTGGGPYKSTTYIVQYIYETGFKINEVGYASAMSVILFAVIGTLTILQFKTVKGDNA